MSGFSPLKGTRLFASGLNDGGACRNVSSHNAELSVSGRHVKTEKHAVRTLV